MHKHLEQDRDLSEMRNYLAPLEQMLQRAFDLGVQSTAKAATDRVNKMKADRAAAMEAGANAIIEKAAEEKASVDGPPDGALVSISIVNEA